MCDQHLRYKVNKELRGSSKSFVFSSVIHTHLFFYYNADC